MTAREHVLRRRLVFATHEAQSAEEASRCHCEAHHGDIKRAPGTGPKMSKMGDAASPAATGGQHKDSTSWGQQFEYFWSSLGMSLMCRTGRGTGCHTMPIVQEVLRVLLACPVRVSEQLNLARLLYWTVEADETPQCPMMLWIQSIQSPWHRPRMPGPVMAATICHQRPIGHVHDGFVPPRRCCRATRLVCQSMSVALAVACRSGRRRLAFSLPGKSTARDEPPIKTRHPTPT